MARPLRVESLVLLTTSLKIWKTIVNSNTCRETTPLYLSQLCLMDKYTICGLNSRVRHYPLQSEYFIVISVLPCNFFRMTIFTSIPCATVKFSDNTYRIDTSKKCLKISLTRLFSLKAYKHWANTIKKRSVYNAG